MPSFTTLPATATLAEREARAAFMLVSIAMPLLRSGHTIADAGWDKIIDSVITTVASTGEGVEGLRTTLRELKAAAG